jgi:hypothetical protein
MSFRPWFKFQDKIQTRLLRKELKLTFLSRFQITIVERHEKFPKRVEVFFYIRKLLDCKTAQNRNGLLYSIEEKRETPEKGVDIFSFVALLQFVSKYEMNNNSIYCVC